MHHLKLLIISHRQNYTNLLSTSRPTKFDQLTLGLTVSVGQFFGHLLALEAIRCIFALRIVTEITVFNLKLFYFYFDS